MREYDKIPCIFQRDTKTKKAISGAYTSSALEFLANNEWLFTEKIDGTNVRVLWDGHKVQFGGRTDDAQIPAALVNKLNELFGGDANEELFEQKFGDKTVMLCGEGYGGKINGNLGYTDKETFILFDVLVGDFWLGREGIEDVAQYFNIEPVPVIMRGTLQEAVDFVKTKPSSTIGKAKLEGLVGKPKVELQNRDGSRVIVKIKVKDLC